LASDGRVDPRGSRVLGVGSVTPLVVRGRAPVLSWVPQKLLPANEDTQARLLDLYKHTDPKLAVALEARIRLAALGATGHRMRHGRRRCACSARHRRRARLFRRSRRHRGALSRQAGRPAGRRGRLHRLGHPHQRGRGLRSARQSLGALDGALAAIETNMGDAWRETVVAVITEFGRTARINGTNGTDHGTGTVAFLAGGALRGGRVDRRLAGIEASPAL
jgi:uncharacterized protein (DUF1501 family)